MKFLLYFCTQLVFIYCKRMYSLLKKVLLAGSIMVTVSASVFAQTALHVIKVKKPKDTHAFFRYTGKDIPIISGHRGGVVKGFPENSIEAFENTLKHTPAFFEIDPRLTKDSVIVLMHDATLDRTTNGTGKLSDYTWKELQQFRLKDWEGNVTDFRIPTLEAVMEWARGKTLLLLDIKDVPASMYVTIIKRLQAEAFVMTNVHIPEHYVYYAKESPSLTFCVHVLNEESIETYDKVGFPWKQCFAYIGTTAKSEHQKLIRTLHSRGATCMVAAAPIYDKLPSAERKEAYIEVFRNGIDVLESDLPIEVADAVKSLTPEKSPKKKYFGVQTIK